MSSSGPRRGGHGGRAGGSGGGRCAREPDAEEAWRLKFVRSVGGKRRAARRYWGWEGAEVPASLVDYSPGGAYFDEQPPMPEEFAREFAREQAEKAAWDFARGGGAVGRELFAGRDLEAGEGSSREGGGEPAVAEDRVLARGDAEEAAAVAKAIAESKAELEAKKEAERQEAARAIAEVEAFKAREAGVVILDD